MKKLFTKKVISYLVIILFGVGGFLSDSSNIISF